VPPGFGPVDFVGAVTKLIEVGRVADGLAWVDAR